LRPFGGFESDERMSFITRRRVLTTAAALPFIRLSAAENAAPEWQSKLEEIRVKYSLPALGGAIVTTEGLQSQAVTGVRKAGEKTPAKVDDLWHLGSNTKAMTSTLAAVAVEAGKLKWDSTLGDVFPKQRDLKKSPLTKATLTQLLSHWSGLPANAMWGLAALGGKDMRSQREAVLRMATELKDLPEPGTKHLYSNWGYCLAGHMLEEVGKADWEDLMRKVVFTPLGIKQAGFGGTGTPGKIDQPWPHGADGKPTESNGPEVDNAPALGPAGTVHMPLSDWALFIAEHLAGRAGKGKLLKTKAAYEHLHTPTQSGEPYAFGWIAVERGWGGRVLNHGGSNTMNRSVTWVAPEKGFAIIACTNTGSEQAGKALDDVAGLLISTHG
jgi:CubicO group peptidase (beta-lactamase class C family)